MDTSFAKAIVLVANLLMIVIRAAYGGPAMRVAVAKRRLSPVRDVPLWIAKWSMLLPIVWSVSPALSFADYPTRVAPVTAGLPLYALGLWLFYRSHADLGTNWSQTLELKADHSLVTAGVYRRIRHPMYLACLIFGAGQALVASNFLAGPSFASGMALLVALRVPHEERMMLDQFGDEYLQ